MNQTRREFLRFGAAVSGLALTGWTALRRDPNEEGRLAALRFLDRAQSPSGSWRSARYAVFRSGEVLTPVVLWALSAGPIPSPFAAMQSRALHWLEGLTDLAARREQPWTHLPYPLFTASYAAQALAANGDPERAALWAETIESLQTSPELGWSPSDPACGAWSDSPVPPHRPASGEALPDMIVPNLSATVLAMQAFLATGRGHKARAALQFVEKCQNYGASGDGGFFFTPEDPIRNKAGIAHRELPGADQIRSYGSTTCDGLLALKACGLPSETPRCQAALGWLEQNADGLAHSGDWPTDRAAGKESLVFYHAQALAAVLTGYAEKTAWATVQRKRLQRDLLARQNTDGSWANAAPDSCEDEPLLATAFAFHALNSGRSSLAAVRG